MNSANMESNNGMEANDTRAERFVNNFYRVKRGDLSDKELEELDSKFITSPKEWAEVREMINQEIEQINGKSKKDYLNVTKKQVENFFLDKLSNEFI
jgi:uncharacterized protein YqeY